MNNHSQIQDIKDQDFWVERGLEFITPNNKRFPEFSSFRRDNGSRTSIGFNPVDLLRGTFFDKRVLDFGCGYGRLCKSVSPGDYLGLDINPSAIDQAILINPNYGFLCAKDFSEVVGIWNFDYLLFYTVLLHLSNDAIRELILSADNILPKRILIVEIIRENRDLAGIGSPGYGHTVSDYLSLFSGYYLQGISELPYPHYQDKNISFITLEKESEKRDS